MTPTQPKPLPPAKLDPTVIEGKRSLWTLHYRKGNNPHPMTKNFWHEGSLREVVERVKKHCETLGERFVRLEPFVVDLNLVERQHLGVKDDHEN